MMFKRIKRWQMKIMAVTPALCIFTFLLLGFVFDLWKYAWLVFLFIPFMPFLIGVKKIRFSFALLITIIYLIIGVFYQGWHPWWILFILVPVFEILAKDKKPVVKKRVVINEDDE